MNLSIKRFAGKIAYWLVPRGFLDLARKTHKRVSQRKSGMGNSWSKHNSPDSPIIKFKNKHAGQRCFILATGPSVNKQDLRGLSNELCIAVGQFHLHEQIEEIRPSYHVLAPTHPPFGFSDLKKLFTGLQGKYSAKMTYFIGHTAYEFSMRNYFETESSPSIENSFFIDYSSAKPLNENNFSDPDIWDIALSPFTPRTVVYEAIQVAVYMGVKDIYLLGCDHDYILDMDRVKNHHFYPEESGISDVEHLSSFTTERWLEEYYYRWKHYRLIDEYCRENGHNIYNATEGGLLDVFPRVDLARLL